MYRFTFRLVPFKCSNFQYKFNKRYTRRYVLIFFKYFLKLRNIWVEKYNFSFIWLVNKNHQNADSNKNGKISIQPADLSFKTYPIIFLECRTYYPETRSCPSLSEDLFSFLHNYTNPRPTTSDELDQVVGSCIGRLLPTGNEVAGRLCFH